jgi:hypothetical protein
VHEAEMYPSPFKILVKWTAQKRLPAKRAAYSRERSERAYWSSRGLWDCVRLELAYISDVNSEVIYGPS